MAVQQFDPALIQQVTQLVQAGQPLPSHLIPVFQQLYPGQGLPGTSVNGSLVGPTVVANDPSTHGSTTTGLLGSDTLVAGGTPNFFMGVDEQGNPIMSTPPGAFPGPVTGGLTGALGGTNGVSQGGQIAPSAGGSRPQFSFSPQFIDQILNEQFNLSNAMSGWVHSVDADGNLVDGFTNVHTGETSADPAAHMQQQRVALQDQLQQLSGDINNIFQGGAQGTQALEQIGSLIARNYPELQGMGANQTGLIAQQALGQGLINQTDFNTFLQQQTGDGFGGIGGLVSGLVGQVNEALPSEIGQNLGNLVSNIHEAAPDEITPNYLDFANEGLAANLQSGNVVDPLGGVPSFFGTSSDAQPIDWLALTGAADHGGLSAARGLGRAAALFYGAGGSMGQFTQPSYMVPAESTMGTVDPVVTADAAQGTPMVNTSTDPLAGLTPEEIAMLTNPQVPPPGGTQLAEGTPSSMIDSGQPGLLTEQPTTTPINSTLDAGMDLGDMTQVTPANSMPPPNSLNLDPLIQGTVGTAAANEIGQSNSSPYPQNTGESDPTGGSTPPGTVPVVTTPGGGNNLPPVNTGGNNGDAAIQNLLNQLLQGGGSGGGALANLLGGLGGAALGVHAAQIQADALRDLANQENQRIQQMMGMGQPFRDQLTATMRPDFDIVSIPGLRQSMDTSMNSLMRSLSTQGNPFGQPGGLMEAQNFVVGNVALPAFQNHRDFLGGAGGLTAYAGGAAQGPNLAPALGAIGAQGQGMNAIGAGLSQLTRRPSGLSGLLGLT